MQFKICSDWSINDNQISTAMENSTITILKNDDGRFLFKGGATSRILVVIMRIGKEIDLKRKKSYSVNTTDS